MPPNPFLIERIILSNHSRFSWFDLDFRDPVTGDLPGACCFIGSGGTGKTALLENLYQSVTGTAGVEKDAFVLTKFRHADQAVYQLRMKAEEKGADVVWFRDSIESENDWHTLSTSRPSAEEFIGNFQEHRLELDPEENLSCSTATAFFSPAEDLVNGERAENFSEFLARHVREREAEFFAYLKQDCNRRKTVAEAEIDFQQTNPGPLSALKEIWDKVPGLAESGNLISVKTGRATDLSGISPGMQRYLLRIGQVFCAWFRKENQHGFLFFDEAESGLHPDLQINLIKIYRSIISNHPAQLFISTNSPLIATQFPEHARILLSYDHDGRVKFSRGIAKEGSDANETLKKDFGIKTAQPKIHSRQQGNYSKLKRAIRESDEQEDELADLIDQMMTIRRI